MAGKLIPSAQRKARNAAIVYGFTKGRGTTIKQIANDLKISIDTVYRALKKANIDTKTRKVKT